MSSPSPDHLGRELAAIEHGGQVATARSRMLSDVGTARAYDLGYVAQVAMRETVRLTQIERELAASTPFVAARLRLLGDAATGCLAEAIVNGTARAMLMDIEQEDR